MTTILSKANRILFLQRVVNAAVTNLGGKTLLIETKTMKVADIVKTFQDHITMMHATAAARTDWLKAAADEQTAWANVIDPLLKGLRNYLVAAFGVTSAVFLAFGFPVRKVGQPSSETRTQGVQKARATRKALMTMGKRQKQEAKRQIASAPATSQPATTASPAPTAPTASPAPSTTAPNGASGSSH